MFNQQIRLETVVLLSIRKIVVGLCTKDSIGHYMIDGVPLLWDIFSYKWKVLVRRGTDEQKNKTIYWVTFRVD